MSTPNETPEYQRGYADAKVTGLLGINVVQEAGRQLVAAADAEIATLREQLGASETERERLHEENAKQAEEIARLKARIEELEQSNVDNYCKMQASVDEARGLKEELKELDQAGYRDGQKLATEVNALRQQLAAAESALTAEQALSEQMRAAWAKALFNFILRDGERVAMAMRLEDFRAIEAALALTPTDALKAVLLEAAEKAYIDGWTDARGHGATVSTLDDWQASETRRALEEGK